MGNEVNMENQEGLFELGGNYYTLKFNMNKIKTVERTLGVSFMAEMQRGTLSFVMLEALFAVGLYDTVEEKAIKGKKASEIYDALLRDVGLSDVMTVTYAKLEEDLGFLFQGN